MAGETFDYLVAKYIHATCSGCGYVTGSFTTKDEIDDAVIGHLIVAHGFTSANAVADAAKTTIDDAVVTKT